MADSALRELLAVFGIKVDDKELKNADKGIDSLAEKLEHLGPTLGKIAKGIGEVFGAEKLKEFVTEGIEAATHVQNLANRLDVSATTLQQFGDVAKGAGIDFDSAANSLGLLQKNLGAADAKGGEAAQAFAKLGINAKEAANTPLPELLGQIAGGLEKLPNQNQKAAAAMQIFGRSGRELLPILGQGKEALEEMLGEVTALGNGLGDRFYSDAKKASEAFEHFGIGLRSIKERALDALLPAIEILGKLLTKVTEGLLELDKKTHLVSTGMVLLAGVIGVGLVDALAAAAVAAWAFLGPFLIAWGPLIAAVGALVWVVQDLWNLMQGGESVLGDLIEKFGGLEEKQEVVAQLKELWKAVQEAINDTAYGLGYFIGIFAGLGKAVAGGDVVTGFFTGLVEIIVAATRGLIGFIQTLLAVPKAIKAGSFDPITKAIDKTGEAIFGKGGALGSLGLGQHSTDVTKYGVSQDNVDAYHAKNLSPATRKLLDRTKPTAVLPGGHGGRGGKNVHIQQHNETKVEVHTGSDKPQDVGNAVGAGVATSNEKNTNAALASVVEP